MISLDQHLVLAPIKEEDQPKLLELMLRVYRPVYGHLWVDDGSSYVHSQFNLSQLKKELNERGSFFYFVKYQGIEQGIIRYIENCSTPGLPQEGSLKLHRLYLTTELHGKGYGKKLMSHVINHANLHGQHSIWLESMDTQQQALNFYTRMGYKPLEHFKLDSPNMRPEYRGMIRMLLELQVLEEC